MLNEPEKIEELSRLAGVTALPYMSTRTDCFYEDDKDDDD